METIRSSETSVLTGATRRHIPEDGILHLSVRSGYGGLRFGAACCVWYGFRYAGKQMYLTREEHWSRKHELYYILLVEAYTNRLDARPLPPTEKLMLHLSNKFSCTDI
jgi:hypothetical protein